MRRRRKKDVSFLNSEIARRRRKKEVGFSEQEGTRFFRVGTRVLNSKSTSTLSAHKSRVSKTQVAIMDLSLINSRC